MSPARRDNYGRQVTEGGGAKLLVGNASIDYDIGLLARAVTVTARCTSITRSYNTYTIMLIDAHSLHNLQQSLSLCRHATSPLRPTWLTTLKVKRQPKPRTRTTRLISGQNKRKWREPSGRRVLIMRPISLLTVAAVINTFNQKQGWKWPGFFRKSF